MVAWCWVIFGEGELCFGGPVDSLLGDIGLSLDIVVVPVQAAGKTLSYKSYQVRKSFAGSKEKQRHQRQDSVVVCHSVFLCKKLHVLDIPAILTLYENTLFLALVYAHCISAGYMVICIEFRSPVVAALLALLGYSTGTRVSHIGNTLH